MANITIDLTTLSGWSALSSGTHNITIVAKAENYRDSEPSAAVMVEKAAEEDALAGTWVFNDVLIDVNGPFYAYSDEPILSLDGELLGIEIIWDSSGILSFDGDIVYAIDEGGWLSESDRYKTIIISSTLSEFTYGDALLEWLQANATKQTTTPALISFTISGTSYQAEEGMTWAEWVESSYNTGNFALTGGYVLYSTGFYVSTQNSTASKYYVGMSQSITNEGTFYLVGTESGGSGK